MGVIVVGVVSLFIGYVWGKGILDDIFEDW
jgi:hypothetical protein